MLTGFLFFFAKLCELKDLLFLLFHLQVTVTNLIFYLFFRLEMLQQIATGFSGTVSTERTN